MSEPSQLEGATRPTRRLYAVRVETMVRIPALTPAAAERLALGVVDASRRECFTATAEVLYAPEPDPALEVIWCEARLFGEDRPLL